MTMHGKIKKVAAIRWVAASSMIAAMALGAGLRAEVGQTTWKFDFGAQKAPQGWTSVMPDSKFDKAKGYGFDTSATLSAVDRGGDAVGGNFLTSDKAFNFSVALPEGNYKVTVTLGDPKGESETTIKSELRRLMLEHVKTASGETVKKTFMVNTRTPNIPGGGQVKLKPRESTSEWREWDDLLTIEFNDKHPCVSSLEIEPAPADIPVVYILGDSTVCDQPVEPWNSWGQMLPRWFKPTVVVANNAESGETFKSSKGAGRLAKVLATLKKGDYVFMQFGHNDMKAGTVEATGYKEIVKEYIDAAKSKGATPVVVSSMERRGGVNGDTLKGFPQAAIEVAKAEGVPYIDLHTTSVELYKAFPAAELPLLFAESSPGVHDGTHHGNFGSYELSKLIVMGIKQDKLPLADAIADDFKDFDPAHPDSLKDFDMPASPAFSMQRPLGD